MKKLLVLAALVAAAALAPGAHAAPLALIHDATVTCKDGASRNDCGPGRLGIPVAGDLVAPCPNLVACWDNALPGGALPVKLFSKTTPAEPLDGCDNPALSSTTPIEQRTIPYPWNDSLDPCRTWKIWPASTFAATGTGTGEAKLQWQAVTQNTDNTPLTNLQGYLVYYGTSSTPNQIVDVGNVVKYDFTTLPPGDWFFAVTALNTAGGESAMSATVTKNIPAPPPVVTTPKAPGSVTIAATSGWDAVKSTNKLTMKPNGTVNAGAIYLSTVISDPTGVYQQVKVTTTSYTPTPPSTSTPFTLFVKTQ